METDKILIFDGKQTICYRTLLRDFLIVNIVAGTAFFLILLWMLLQRYHVLPSYPCTIHELFHVYCPGCGGTRAVRALFNGKVAHSLYANPAVILGIVLILYYETGIILTLIKKNGKRYYYPKGALVYGYVIFIVAFAVMRDYLLVVSGIDMLGDFL